MDIPADLLPQAYLWTGLVLCLPLMLAALWSAPWSKIGDSEAQHVFLGTIVALSLLWVMRGGIHQGLNFHLLGMTLMCLMFEWQFALVGASLIVAIASAAGGTAAWPAFALNVMLMAALPILFTRACLYVGQRWLPHNFYLYIFVNAFLVGSLSMLLVGLASAALQHLGGVHPAGTISRDFVQILPLLMFGEGFINGGAMALLVAYRPHWVATFHDAWYLRGK